MKVHSGLFLKALRRMFEVGLVLDLCGRREATEMEGRAVRQSEIDRAGILRSVCGKLSPCQS